MDNANHNCILLFVKYPTDGRVKTRLAATLGPDAAAKLYQGFVFDILAALTQLRWPFKICFYPDSAGPQTVHWLGEKYSYIPQTGRDIGERMKDAFVAAFAENFERAILIGSDIPDLPPDYIRRAFEALDSNDVVLGPSSDGGYYLIGFTKHRFLLEAFAGIAWSTHCVFDQTLDIITDHKRTVHLLPQWHDVDTPADLDRLVARNKDTPFNQSKTIALIRKITEGT